MDELLRNYFRRTLAGEIDASIKWVQYVRRYQEPYWSNDSWLEALILEVAKQFSLSISGFQTPALSLADIRVQLDALKPLQDQLFELYEDAAPDAPDARYRAPILTPELQQVEPRIQQLIHWQYQWNERDDLIDYISDIVGGKTARPDLASYCMQIVDASFGETGKPLYFALQKLFDVLWAQETEEVNRQNAETSHYFNDL